MLGILIYLRINSGPCAPVAHNLPSLATVSQSSSRKSEACGPRSSCAGLLNRSLDRSVLRHLVTLALKEFDHAVLPDEMQCADHNKVVLTVIQ